MHICLPCVFLSCARRPTFFKSLRDKYLQISSALQFTDSRHFTHDSVELEGCNGRNLSKATQLQATCSLNLALTNLISNLPNATQFEVVDSLNLELIAQEDSWAPSWSGTLVKIRMFIHVTRILLRERERD